MGDHFNTGSKPCIWITRPQPQASIHVAALEALGFETIISPVLHVNPLDIQRAPSTEFMEADALIATSVNGFAGLPTDCIKRMSQIPVFVSGSATAERATTLGFRNVHCTAGKGSRGVVDMVRSACPKSTAGKSPKLLYLAGTPRTPFLEEQLAPDYTLSVIETYEAVLVPDLSAALKAAFEHKQNMAVTLFSSRSAHHAADLVRQTFADKADAVLGKMPAICISPTVVAVAVANGFANAITSDAESGESIVNKLVEQLKIN